MSDLATVADSFRDLEFSPERLEQAHRMVGEVRAALVKAKLADDARAAYASALDKLLTFIRDATAWNVTRLQQAEEAAHGIGGGA